MWYFFLKFDDESGSESTSDEERSGEANKVYKPPKLAAMHYG